MSRAMVGQVVALELLDLGRGELVAQHVLAQLLRALQAVQPLGVACTRNPRRGQLSSAHIGSWPEPLINNGGVRRRAPKRSTSPTVSGVYSLYYNSSVGPAVRLLSFVTTTSVA